MNLQEKLVCLYEACANHLSILIPTGTAMFIVRDVKHAHVVPLPPGENPYAIEINNSNNLHLLHVV
jgi:hypothetical protein